MSWIHRKSLQNNLQSPPSGQSDLDHHHQQRITASAALIARAEGQLIAAASHVQRPQWPEQCHERYTARRPREPPRATPGLDLWGMEERATAEGSRNGEGQDGRSQHRDGRRRQQGRRSSRPSGRAEATCATGGDPDPSQHNHSHQALGRPDPARRPPDPQEAAGDGRWRRSPR